MSIRADEQLSITTNKQSMHLATHGKNLIFTKHKQLGLKLQPKILLYTKIFWTYGIHQCGTASKSNIDILKRFKNKVMCMAVSAPYYVPNEVIQRDIPFTTISEVIKHVFLHHYMLISQRLIKKQISLIYQSRAVNSRSCYNFSFNLIISLSFGYTF